MLKFIEVCSTYDDFTTFFNKANLDFTNPEVELFYTFVLNNFSYRYFRWEALEEIQTLSCIHLENAFWIYRSILKISKMELENLLANISTSKAYGLPGEEEKITNENDENYLVGKQLNTSTMNKLDIIRRLSNSTIFNGVREELAQMFISWMV